ncbi:hypothetical protein TNCV_2825501 [Trichonephila clavipes]|nr:hypothetical protein TNCV_2825501 [Trichonephila clavipes]
MYKRALKEDFIRVVENLDGTVETKVEEKQFKTLNKETATHIGIREAEDWFRPIDLAKEVNIIGLCCSEGSLSLGSGNEGKREIVLNRRPELYRGKISMRSTKDQLVEKDVLMPVKTMFSCGTFRMSKRCLHMMEKLSNSPLVSMEVPLRTAYGQNGRCGMQPKARQVFARAGAAKARTETCELVEERTKTLGH